MNKDIDIKDFSYFLPEDRIARFPLDERDRSKLLVFKNGQISHTQFDRIAEHLPPHSLLVFNNTKVIRARLMFFKESGARIEIFCLEPYAPADYERAFAQTGSCQWKCMVGNLKKWKSGALHTRFTDNGKEYVISASRQPSVSGNEEIIEFQWNHNKLSFGQILELLGRIPIPPYLNRESCETDNTRYQTVYSKIEGSVAAPTAGLHFTNPLIEELKRQHGMETEEITLHVGAGTFLPVKHENAAMHVMHAEHFDITRTALRNICRKQEWIIAVGTTSVRTLESLSVIGYRIMRNGSADTDREIGQWEAYDIPDDISGRQLLEALENYMERHNLQHLPCSTRIMIVPGYRFRIIRGMITNFHQPQSTLLLLISALIGDTWRAVYDYALSHDFRFLSYGDSSLLLPACFTSDK